MKKAQSKASKEMRRQAEEKSFEGVSAALG